MCMESVNILIILTKVQDEGKDFSLKFIFYVPARKMLSRRFQLSFVIEDAALFHK